MNVVGIKNRIVNESAIVGYTPSITPSPPKKRSKPVPKTAIPGAGTPFEAA